jgi:hypothetical protein
LQKNIKASIHNKLHVKEDSAALQKTAINIFCIFYIFCILKYA